VHYESERIENRQLRHLDRPRRCVQCWLEWQWEDGTSDNTDCGFDSVRPIPLTEEWILKFGAEKQTQYQFVHGRFRLIWKPEYKYWYVIHNDTLHYMNKIEFVHEWQNFMFVMGSEELQIQEP
jgi:hypothetical protein